MRHQHLRHPIDVDNESKPNMHPSAPTKTLACAYPRSGNTVHPHDSLIACPSRGELLLAVYGNYSWLMIQRIVWAASCSTVCHSTQSLIFMDTRCKHWTRRAADKLLIGPYSIRCSLAAARGSISLTLQGNCSSVISLRLEN